MVYLKIALVSTILAGIGGGIITIPFDLMCTPQWIVFIGAFTYCIVIGLLISWVTFYKMRHD